MSIVRYTNKKTGVVSLYESTSHYDPVTKQSRPKRKYLGTEDPATGKLIPSSGKRGRKKKGETKAPTNKEKSEAVFKEKYDKLLAEYEGKDEKIKQLEHENNRLRLCIQKLRDTADAALKSEEQ